MILPPAATAASGADPSNPSLNQYVESVPSSHGNQPRPPGGGSSSGDRLSASVRHEIQAQGGADAKQLEAVAGSPALGAPATRRGAHHGSAGGSSSSPGTRAADERRPSGLSAITTAATHGQGSSVGVLLGGLALITALAGGMALARKRSDIA